MRQHVEFIVRASPSLRYVVETLSSQLLTTSLFFFIFGFFFFFVFAFFFFFIVVINFVFFFSFFFFVFFCFCLLMFPHGCPDPQNLLEGCNLACPYCNEGEDVQHYRGYQANSFVCSTDWNTCPGDRKRRRKRRRRTRRRRRKGKKPKKKKKKEGGGGGGGGEEQEE